MTQWPKVLPPLEPQQQAIIDDSIKRWHENPPGTYRIIDRFNHRYPLRSCPPGDARFRTIEIGSGMGEQLAYEDLSRQDFTCVEMRTDMVEGIRRRFPSVTVIEADCQTQMPFPDGHFDRGIAVHVLEHLPNLPGALDELRRVLRPGGKLSIVIPCDPGWLYGLGRKFTAQRKFEREYGLPYDLFIRREHINSPSEIVDLVRERFRIEHRAFYPFRLPSVNLNVFLGLTAVVDPPS